MAGMLYGFPFNEELFSYLWENEPDPVTEALINSGAVQNNARIASMISQGSDLYTIPFYKTIGGEPANYDGKTDMPVATSEGAYQSGIVYGRMQGWKAQDFVVDYNSGANPMAQIVSQVAHFWAKQDQAMLVNLLTTVFAVDADEGAEQWKEHTTDIAAPEETVTADNKLGATTIGDAAVKACGDHAAGAFNLAIMHSQVAQNLAGLNLLEFRRYTDPSGIERALPIADANGYTVVVFDGVPVDTQKPTAPKYTTFLLGNGCFQHAMAPVKVPVEYDRDPVKNGGEEMLYTRRRLTFHPNGFTYTKQPGDGPSPTDENLKRTTAWKPIYDPRFIAMAQIVSNG